MHGGHHDGREWRFQELAATLGDAKVAAQQGLRRGGAEANDNFRTECGDFGIEPRVAGSYFRSIGFFVDATFSTRFPLEVPGCLHSKSNPLATEFSGEVDNLEQGVENLVGE